MMANDSTSTEPENTNQDFLREIKAYYPSDFLWGAATAAFQIEGARHEDGKGDSIWDHFCDTPGKIENNDNGNTACDHFHRYPEDVQLMKNMGLTAYRFSLSWARIFPKGIGPINEKGLQFYKNLLTELRSAGITPFITLYHWDLPLELQKMGGWCHPESSDWFAFYTRTVVEAFKDDCQNWMTFNEPNIFVPYGLGLGNHAPGLKLTPEELLLTHKNIMLAHGKSYSIIKAIDSKMQVGIVPAMTPLMPHSKADLRTRNLAKQRQFSVYQPLLEAGDHEFKNIGWWIWPLLYGKYPEGFPNKETSLASENDRQTEVFLLSAKELASLKGQVDFLGVNTYTGYYVDFDHDSKMHLAPYEKGYPRTTMNWAVYPESLYYALNYLSDLSSLPIFIAENGMASNDWVHANGKVPDLDRIDFLQQYLEEATLAVKEGVKLKGYFAWSLMDNFEWACGLNQRFGLIHIDFETKARTPKESSKWYQELIRFHRGALH
jgi:beta-glucosidase